MNYSHVEGNVTALVVAARPPDSAGAPDARDSRPLNGETHAIKIPSELEIKAAFAPPARQISLKLSADDATRVNVDLTAKGGKIQVAVRTPDQELAKSLQSDLGDLVGRLESKGLKTETWMPASPHPMSAASQPSSSNPGFGPPQQSGSGHGGGQQRQQQNSSNQRQQARWTAQMEETVSTTEARSEDL
jgi:hypothetical protein